MKTKPAYPTRDLLFRLLQVMRHLLPFIALAVVFALLGFLTTLAVPSILMSLAFSVLDGQSLSIWTLPLLIGLALARGAFRYGEHYFGHYVAFHSLADLRKLIFAKLRRLAPAKLDRQDSGQLLKLIAEDIEALEIFFAHTLAPICTGLLSALFIGIYFFLISPWLALIALLTYAVLAAALPWRFARRLQALLDRQNQERTAYLSYFLESLKAMQDLLQFAKEKERFSSLEAQSQAVNSLERQVAQEQFIQQAATFLTVGLSLMLFAVCGLYQVAAGQLSVQALALALVAFASSFAPFLELGRLPLGFKRAMNAGRNVFGLLDEKEQESGGSQAVLSLDDIQLENVSFAYDQREQQIFENLSAGFKKGRMIGLTGSSGCGKSTLVKLVMRWYDVQQGSVSFSGQATVGFNRQHIQSSFAYVPQVAQLFHQSLRENLLLGREGVSDQEIWNLAERCRLKERLEALPQGLDTVIDGTADFSAGEQQRLELMRALLKEADCYIFDEPTSNLDSLNEAAFLAIVKEECRGMVFLISHRLSTLALADEIYQVSPSMLRRIQ